MVVARWFDSLERPVIQVQWKAEDATWTESYLAPPRMARRMILARRMGLARERRRDE